MRARAADLGRRGNHPAARRPAGVTTRPVRSGRDGGNATVELALSLPALVLLVVVGLSAVSAVRTQLECVDAAREAARAVAREAPVPGSPDGVTVEVSLDGDLVRATARARLDPLGGRLPGFDISATAVAAREPGGP